ncbi:leucine-rich repeat domain-containing protein [Proteinivorax hydrogeniformans]|uniref:Leucine-rich repeat domain-containing protein n=1 Tax=Proteinivorax hydrogeniformans TaxID=1826727 RepID=A0AAU8HRL2_9FIRM
MFSLKKKLISDKIVIPVKKNKKIVTVLMLLIIFSAAYVASSSHLKEINAIAIPKEGGVVKGGGGYNIGQKVAITAEPKDGYRLEKWIVDGEKIYDKEQLLFEVEKDSEVEAHFVSLLVQGELKEELKALLEVEGNLTKDDLKKVKTLTTTSQINDLTGLEYATNLQEISLEFREDAAIAGMDRIRHLSQLKVLNLPNSSICTISDLEKLNSLRSLNLQNNDIDDLFGLRGLINLKELDLSHNSITDLSPLLHLTSLEKLDLSHNQIADLTPLANMTNLKVLKLEGNKIEDVTALQGLHGLEELCLKNNAIEDIDALANLKNLTELDLSYNNINNVEPLAKLDRLAKLDIQNNNSSQAYSQLVSLPSIENMVFDGAAISNYITVTDDEKVQLEWSPSREYVFMVITSEGKVRDMQIADFRLSEAGDLQKVVSVAKQDSSIFDNPITPRFLVWDEEKANLKIKYNLRQNESEIRWENLMVNLK